MNFSKTIEIVKSEYVFDKESEEMKQQIIGEIAFISKEQQKEVLSAIKRIKKRNTTNNEKPFENGEWIEYMGSKAVVQTNEGKQGIVKVGNNNFEIEMWEWECGEEVCRRI